jgi:uncharacterized membrane protein
MRVLFAGEGDLHGPARYLAGAILAAGARLIRRPWTARLTRSDVSGADAIILSDYPRRHPADAVQRRIAERVARGMGLLMVGGWSSFAAPFGGGWQGSRLEGLLPVRCLRRDDRRNVASGVLMRRERAHPILRGLPLNRPPILCGFNEVRPTAAGVVLLSAIPLVTRAGGIALGARCHPLLVIDRDPRRRVAALTTDVAPHWCGGLVDWGRARRTIRVAPGVDLTVGDAYLRFLGQLIRWLGNILS